MLRTRKQRRTRRRRTRGFAFLTALFLLCSPYTASRVQGQSRPGDVAKNLQMVPPWTLYLCSVEKQQVLRATYDREEAKALRLLDAVCQMRTQEVASLRSQLRVYEKLSQNLFSVRDLGDQELRLCDARNQTLFTQLKKEIALKNKYKYRPTYHWLYLAVGGAVALTGIAFGVGVWIAD